MSAKTYGTSFYELAKEEGLEDRLLSDMRALSKLFKEYPDYVKILDSPRINRGELLNIINEDFSDRVDRYTLNFLKLLSEKRMVRCFDECLKEYERIYNNENNVKVVDVITANPLSEALTKKLRDKLTEKLGGKVVLNKRIDKSCIGGIIIETDKVRIDADIRGEIDKIRRALTYQA